MAKFYHVEITPKTHQPPHRRVEQSYDLSIGELERRFLDPYRKARPLVIRGRPIEIDELHRMRVYETDHEVGNPTSMPKDAMKDITEQFINEYPGSQMEKASEGSQLPTDTREVFVAHGRNEKARKALFEFLRSIDLRPLEWAEFVQQTGKGSPYVGEILDAAFARAHAVVVLFTPDEEVRLKEQFRVKTDPSQESEWTGQARPNVLFEAGMALAQDQERTILVELGMLRPVSDMAGRHTIRLDDTPEKRNDLAQRLATAGCPVNLDGTDWLTAGDFGAALEESLQPSSESAVTQSATIELPQLTEEAKELLLEAVKDKRGEILKVSSMGGMSIRTNGREFLEEVNPRLEAIWVDAFKELFTCGFVFDETGHGQVFRVTRAGYEAAEVLQGS